MTSAIALFALLMALLSTSVVAFVPRMQSSRIASRMNVEMKDSGKVKFFDTTKGFGFITPSKGGEDIFVHQTAVYAQGFRSLAEGEDVEFDVSEDKAKGRKFATNVTGPNGAYVQGSPRRERAPMGNGGGYDRY